MQLICPHCGQPVTAENINIQRMAAVCPACHTVFQFDPSDSDSKITRRKVKQPPHIISYESDSHLNIAFRTNFPLDKNEAFLFTAGFSAFFTFITIVLASQSELPLITLGFGLFTLMLYYLLGLVAFNKTHIEISDEEISVSRKPLPNLLTQPNTISLSGIKNVRYEETAASKKEGYETPRYNVWAERVDRNRKLIVGDVVEDYAVFISQRLNELLGLDSEPDVSRLSDDQWETDDEQSPEDVIGRSKSPLT